MDQELRDKAIEAMKSADVALLDAREREAFILAFCLGYREGFDTAYEESEDRRIAAIENASDRMFARMVRYMGGHP